ncbi:Putative sensor with HAMP domain [Thermobacillus xylanilyticus]|uniref:histidine kinase n=1 Tax=Thermobacillus xylanilyticus TaxID=76633 RepID=A0ABN7S863_THEXY|nr:sensor histidine kinase [Thermobacillus xylanilyticus]CAG5091656.1 Putative sensor with HAMP domain [Thermobacillus xylanilyticus]
MLLRFIEKAAIRITSSLNLRGKILLLYGAIVLLPTVILGAVAGYFTLASVRSNYMVTIREALRQTAQNIEFRKQSYDVLTIRTATDGELIARLSREYGDMAEQLDTVTYVDRSFMAMSKYLPGIRDFRIYHMNPTLVQDGSLLWKPEERPLAGMPESEWYRQTLASDESPAWRNVPDSPGELVLTHKILARNGQAIGLVFMKLSYDTVFGELLEHPFNGAGELYIIDAENRIIAATNRGMIGRIAESAPLQQAAEGVSGETEGWSGVEEGGSRYFSQPAGSGWNVAAVIHMDQLERRSRHIMYGIAGGVAFFLLLSMFMVLTVMKNIVLRIRKIGNRMNDVAQGEFDVTVHSRGDDELGELELLFNSMSGKLGKLVHDMARVKLKEREQSFRALQAQINPHFIYNSLSLIRWRAMDLGDDMQIRTIDALTTFYRLALDNTINVTRIETELQHVRAYLEIQQLRYPDMVRIEWDIDPDVSAYYTIKLLLQPIVENCYVHGEITKKPGAYIRIAAKRTDGRIRFEVEDNGKGIPPETALLLMRGERTGTGNGFGTTNIRERLRLYFGSGSEFAIDSRVGEGTRVTITIPACLERPEIRREEEA